MAKKAHVSPVALFYCPTPLNNNSGHVNVLALGQCCLSPVFDFPFPILGIHSECSHKLFFFFQFSPGEGGCKRQNQSIGLTPRDRLLFTLTHSGLEFQVLRCIPETTMVNPCVNGTSCISSTLPNLTQVLCSLFHPFCEMCTKAKLYRPYSHDHFPLMCEAQMLSFKSYKHWQKAIISWWETEKTKETENLERHWKICHKGTQNW